MRTTLPGTVQLVAIADQGETERVAEILRSALIDGGFSVITTTADSADRYDPNRRKFHVIAVPVDELEKERQRKIAAGEKNELVEMLNRGAVRAPVSAEHGRVV